MQRCDHDYVPNQYSSLVNLKNRGGLISCSDSVFKIVFECETLFYLYTENLKKIFVENLTQTIINQCTRKFSLDHNIFPSLNCENVSILERPHKLLLITIIAKKFLKIRLNSFSKVYTESINELSKRHLLTKTILFSNQ